MFIAVDYHNAECVGIHAAPHVTRFEALEPVRQDAHQYFSAFVKSIVQGLSIHHDHGSQYMSAVLQDELTLLDLRETYNTTWLIQRLGYQTLATAR